MTFFCVCKPLQKYKAGVVVVVVIVVVVVAAAAIK